MTDIFNGKARLVAMATMLGLSPLCLAQAGGRSPATPLDGFDKVVADGASLVAPSQTYQALVSDKSFRGTLERWSRNSGWHLSWELDSEYAFNFEARFEGDFLKAVDGVCANLNASGVSARAIAYEGNKVIRIVAEGTHQ